jgi:hypothetical protein
MRPLKLVALGALAALLATGCGATKPTAAVATHRSAPTLSPAIARELSNPCAHALRILEAEHPHVDAGGNVRCVHTVFNKTG